MENTNYVQALPSYTGVPTTNVSPWTSDSNSMPFLGSSISPPTAAQSSASAASTPWINPDTGKVFVNSGDESSWGEDIWDWANTETGSNVIGGALAGAGSAWESELAADESSEKRSDYLTLAREKIASAESMNQANIEARMKLAMLGENRKDKHNKSINAPINMSVRKFK